jgi:hypothetical protein
MQVNRGLVFWGVGLVTAGAVALAIQSDFLSADVARDAWRFWPVVLIAIGISVIAARTPFALVATLAAGLVAGALVGTLVAGIPEGLNLGCGGDIADRTAVDGTFGGEATVELEFNCGDLSVEAGDGDAWSLDAGFADGAEPDISSDGTSLRVDANREGVIGFANARQDWNVTLPSGVTLDLGVTANAGSSALALGGMDFSELSVDMNAGEIDVDLAGTSVTRLSASANAGSLSITVDESTTADGSLNVNAGSVELCVADGTAIEITVNDSNITFSHNLDDSGLDRSGDTWRSGDGNADVTLDIEGNAASFTYNPTGGCS